MVQVWPNPTAGFSYDPIHPSIQEPEVHFYDSSSGANSKFWTISTGDTILQDNFMYIFPKEDSATYIVKQFVSTGKGCSDTAAMRVIVDFVTTFYVPDAFTPDGNDVNETFGPKTYGVQVEDFRMEIYNRWGEQIWVTDTFGVEWDGSILGSGEQADKGAYTWVIYYREQTGLMQVQRGNVLLLR
jgi:gliding motility-associated-like protein